MFKKRVATWLCGVFVAASLSLMSVSTVKASEYTPVASKGSSSSSGWFSIFKSRSGKSYYSKSTKKAVPSMSNGSFYEKWRADRKASGRAHRP